MLKKSIAPRPPDTQYRVVYFLFIHFSLDLTGTSAINLVVFVQSLSCVQLFVTPWTAACQASLSFTISRSLLKVTSIESMMPSNHLILCSPLFLLPSIFPSIRVFSDKLAPGIRWPKYWSFSFSISPSNEYSRLISFRIDWFDVLNLAHAIKIRNIKALELTHQRHTLQL